MADVITRFKLETTQYDSALRDAAKGLQAVTHQATLAGSEFDKFTRQSVEQARAFGDIATSATNAKDKVKELVGAYNDVAKSYNALNKEQQQSDYGKALAESMQKLKGRISEAKGEMQKMGETGKGTGSILDQFTGKLGISTKTLGVWGAALGAGKVALDVAKDAFFACETNVDDWGRTVEASQSIYEGFLQTLNSGDFSSFLSRIDEIISKANDAYNALDNLQTRMTIINPERARLQAQLTEQKVIVRREGANSEAGKAAQQKIRDIEKQLTNAFTKESSMNLDVFKTQVDKKLKEAGIVLSKRSYEILMQSFSSDDVYNQLKKGAKGSMGRNYEAGGSYDEGSTYTYDTRNTNQKLLDLFTDEWRKQWAPFLTASANAKNSAFGTMLADSRYLKGGGAGGGRTGGGGGSMAQYAYSVPEFTRSNDFVHVSPWQMMMENRQTTMTPDQGIIDFSPLEKFDIEIQALTEAMMKATDPEEYQRLSKARQSKQKDRDNFTGDSKQLQELVDWGGQMMGGVNSIVSGIEGLGIEIPEGLRSILGGLNSLLSIASGISTILIAISMKPFAHGGIVPHAASGFMVPGNNFSGDVTPILANAGEVVLNKAQQGVLANQLSQPAGGDGGGISRVSGEQIYVVLNRYLRRSGRGELATWG